MPEMYLLIRYNSAYTINDFLLGVFQSKELAEQSRQIYINKRKIYDLYAEQGYHIVDLNKDVYIDISEEIEIVCNNYVKILIKYANGFGQETVSLHNLEIDVNNDENTFVNHKENVLYEINKLYDELGKFSDKLPDKYTQQQIDEYKDYLDDPY
jgi:hypothetical protein